VIEFSLAGFKSGKLPPSQWKQIITPAQNMTDYSALKLPCTRTVYSCFEKDCPTKPYATMPKGIMAIGGPWSLIEALGVSATSREAAETNEFLPCLFLFKQTAPNSFYP